MIIPPRLSSLLQTNDQLNGAVLQTISIVRPWFEDNKLVFFPEYTDHGPKHIQEVFDTTESLITETAWRLLVSEDVATLIVGILLHDCAMHLSEDGFISLISDGSRPRDEGFRDKSWPQLWDEFMAEAKRFDERKLKALFDDAEPVQTPSLDPLTMSKRDGLLIGEFLRRHHPRLAHEIALLGVPGPMNKGLPLGDLPQHIQQLGGLVARSHGLDLRVSVDYLNQRSKWGARRTLGVHMTYLMVLVRIADYLQIHSNRAPQEVLRVRSLRSPVSRGEWNVHAAIKDIHQETDDPEALWVEGTPEDVQTYLKLKYLLNDIQRELDDSWAVLGEVYGPKEGLREFGIKLRRIKSNIQDQGAFAKIVTYIPSHAALDTAGVNLLKLLITPLYGDSPEIGIRELLQNAVDACRELKDYLNKHPQLGIEQQKQMADVMIELHERDDKTKWLTVSDCGIGMTVDTILNYFLKAGASFRNSFAWRKQHEDEHGETQVLRSGRFGIGVLAGFLLGSEIHVTTRHVTAQPHEAIGFTCRLEDECIQLNRINRTVGTTISIQLSNAIYRGLVGDLEKKTHGEINWDWYCLAEPSVYRLTPAGQLSQRCVLPLVDSDLPLGWRRISHPEYRDIHWSYSNHAYDLTCNGIAIADLNSHGRYTFEEPYESVFRLNGIVCPRLSVFDPNGSFPLNLQRTALSVRQLPFEDELIEDICLDILAYLLVHTPRRKPSHIKPKLKEISMHLFDLSYPDSMSPVAKKRWNHPAIRNSISHYYVEKGLALLDPWNIQQLKTKTICSFSDPALLRVVGKEHFESYIYKVTYQNLYDDILMRRGIGWLNISNYRLILNGSMIKWLEREQADRDERYHPLDGTVEEDKKGKWKLLRVGHCPQIALDLNNIPLELDEEESNFLLIVYPRLDEEMKSVSRLAQAWREVIRLPYIPYDMATRKKQLADAYQRLSYYTKLWEKV
jgi:molecular chaperone HtpG